MRKSASFILLCSTVLAMAQAPVTCSLDAAFIASNKKGIYPDSAHNFVSGIEYVAYAQNITVKVPKDTVQGPIKICFNRVEVSTPQGFTNFNLPQGLSLMAGPTVTTSGGIFQFPGNDNSCAVISGTPAMPGTYTVQFKVTTYGNPISATGSCPTAPNTTQGVAVNTTTLSYYVINVGTFTGFKEAAAANLFNLTNSPNPFSQKTTLKFTVKDAAPARICVYSLLGNKIYEDQITATYGDNNYELNTASWNSGIYLYTIQYKNHTETRKMVLSSN